MATVTYMYMKCTIPVENVRKTMSESVGNITVCLVYN